jgi:hypothetical protein
VFYIGTTKKQIRQFLEEKFMTKLNRNSFVEKKDTPLQRQIILAVMLFGIFVFANVAVLAQTTPCDIVSVQVITRVSTNYTDTQSGAFGYSRYEIRRNGEIDHYIHLFYDAPDNTVFKAYFNGTEVATLQRVPSSLLGEYWSWEGMDQSPPVGHVGDVMSITMNGQPFLTGSYTREAIEYEAADASVPVGSPSPCSVYRAAAYLPTSSHPQTLRSGYMSAASPVSDPVTSITINEPGDMPGELGAEIAQIPLGSTITLGGSGWMATGIVQTDTVLTNSQFTMLRQGLLTVNTFTAAHPEGYTTTNIHTQGINTGSDFEGDGGADLTVFRPSELAWYMKLSSNNQTESVIFGHVNDKLVVGDYDSDRKADIATYRPDDPDYPGQGVWKILRSSDGAVQSVPWGLDTDTPIAMSVDTNNATDLGIFRPSTGTWYIKRMGDIIKPLAKTRQNEKSLSPENNAPQSYTIQWGKDGDIPLAGDFDNDKIDELVIFRPSEGNWYIYNFAKNSYQISHWGLNGDIPIARDFDGDRKADLAVYRPSNGAWYIYGSLENNVIIRNLGISGDIPVPADFDKDGVADIAVYRPRNGVWYINGSAANSYYFTKFGSTGDIPAVTPR